MNSSPLSRLSKPRLLQPYPHGGTEKGSRGKAHEPAPVHRQGIGFRFRSFWHLLRCPIPPRHLLILVAIILQLLVPPLSVRASAREPLTLLVHPFLPAAELTRSFTPLTDYLSRTCGVPVRLEITKNYASHIRRVGEERFDIAFLGPAPFVEVTRTYGSKILLGRLEDNGSPFFHGVIIARRDSPIKNLNGLAGKRFAFGDPNSTMSHIVPRVMLAEAGIKTEQLQGQAFLGMHQNVVLGVLGGYYDAGAVKENIFNQYKGRGLKSLARTPAVSEHLFVAGKNLPKATVACLRQSLLNLRDKAVLSAIKGSLTGIVPAEDSNYDSLRVIMQKFDRLPAK